MNIWHTAVRPVLDDKLRNYFQKRVNKTDSCWLWTGRRFVAGYGMVECLDLNTNKKRKTTAHRIAWMLDHGFIERNLFVCHTCDNPPCVRPDHLFIGTQSMNLQDAISKGRFQNIARGRPLIGERNKNTELSSDDVTAIKVLAKRNMGPTLISQIFRTSTNTIHRILAGKSWKYHA